MSFVYDGLHLMIDALVKDSETLVKHEVGVQMLEAIVEEIDMTMILPPVTVNFPHAICEMQRVLEDLEAEGLGNSNAAQSIKQRLQERKNEAYGYSTFVMIAESHISIHTFPELNYISFDCYSCKSFDVNKVIDTMKKFFDLEKVDMQVVNRRNPVVS